MYRYISFTGTSGRSSQSTGGQIGKTRKWRKIYHDKYIGFLINLALKREPR